MSSHLSDTELKAEPKWQAITSLVFGFICIVPYIMSLFRIYPETETLLKTILTYSGIFLYSGSWLFGATAFVLGIMGLKYRTRPIAIAGIILSLIGLVVYTTLYNLAVHNALPV